MKRVRGDESEAMRYRPATDFGLFAPSSPATINPAPATSRVSRVLHSFEERKPTNASLAYVRGKLVELYDERVRTMPESCWWVSADHADRILQAWSEFPSGGSQNWRGGIFRGKGWERLYPDVPSLRGSHNGTPLARWRPRR